MWNMNRAGVLAALLAVGALATGCDQDETRTITEVTPPDTVTVTVRDTVTITRTDTVRIGNPSLVFNQIERLGNPLVSEALLEKRLHGFFNTTNPPTDSMFFYNDIVGFVVNVAGRDSATANAIAGILLPDQLLVFPNRAAGVTAANSDDSGVIGWLTWALAPGEGYGGRKLDNDDAVDKALGAVFGSILSDQNVSPGLATDNVGDVTMDPNTFPYVAAPF